MPMSEGLIGAIPTGAFAIIGGYGGVLLTSRMNTRVQNQRQSAEDARRWLQDRREIYARFLSIAESILRSIDSTAAFMSYDGKQSVTAEEQGYIREGVFDNVYKMDDELEPVLYEIQLMSSSTVADLADRVCGALMLINEDVHPNKIFTEYYPGWFQARDLIEVLRDSMRQELGLSALEAKTFPRDSDWPWLPSRPTGAAYVQHHPSRTNKDASNSQDK